MPWSQHFAKWTRSVTSTSSITRNVPRVTKPAKGCSEPKKVLEPVQTNTFGHSVSSRCVAAGVANSEAPRVAAVSVAAEVASAAKSATPQSDRSLTSAAPRPFKEIPGPRGLYQLPFVGTVLLYKPFSKFIPENSPALFEHLFKRYGPIVRVQFGRSTVLIHEPADLEQLMKNEGRHPLRPGFGLTERYNARFGLQSSLGDSNGAEWQRLRSPLNRQMLKVDSASPYLESQGQVADELVTSLLSFNGSWQEMQDLFYRYACESIGLVCFNTRMGLMDADWAEDTEASGFVEYTKLMFDMFHRVISGKSMMHHFYANGTYVEYEKCNNFLRPFASKKLCAAVDALKSQADGARDGAMGERNLLAALMAEKDLEFEDVKNSLISLCIGGLDSTAKNLQVFFYMLAMHPAEQDKLYDEIISVIGKTGPVTKEALARMDYLKACAKESFRVRYPTMTGPVRLLPKDTVIHNYTIPAGTQVVSCNAVTCKRYFPQPDQFLPERWTRSEEHRKLSKDIPKLACQPFGYGPRHCIGRRFAEQEIYLAAVKTLQRARIEIEDQSRDMSFYYSVFISPSKPIKFRFIERDGTNS